MAQHYSNPQRASDAYSLPDVETFTARYGDCPYCSSTVIEDGSGQFHCEMCEGVRRVSGVVPAEINTGWFYWFCFPGCMPEGDPSGPYASEAEAVEAFTDDTDDLDDTDDTDQQ